MPVTSPPARWPSPPPGYDSSPAVRFGTTLTPYLQLPHLLSLTWLAYPILSLLFIAFRLVLSQDSIQSSVDSAKDNLLASCRAAQEAAASTASMPRYMAVASNELIIRTTNASLDAARQALVLSLTIMEAIINFVIDTYRSTLLCFIELIVRGALSILISASEEISSLITSTANGLATTIQDSVSGINSALSSIDNEINKLPFGDKLNIPTFSTPDLSSLQNFKLPTDFTDALTKLNSSIPSPAQLKQEFESIIDTPFELVKKEINDTFLGISFNSSTFPIPERATLSFCDDMDTSVVDDLGSAFMKMTRIGIIIIIVLALLLVAGNCLLEWYKWRSLQKHLEYTRQAWMSDPTVVHTGLASAPTIDLSNHNLLMLAANSEHPLITRFVNRAGALLHFSPSQHIHFHWFLHYIFHPPALACFLIGFFGILSVQIQLFALSPLEAHFRDQAAGAAADFSRTIATSMNASMYNQSATYAAAVNSQIDAVQGTINNNLFGWVNGTTTTLNSTLNTFYSDVQNVVNAVFGGTPLAQPAQEFIQCFIGSKVDAVENALTFLHDHLQVNVTRVNDTVDEAVQPIALAAVGGNGSDDNDSLVGRLVNAYAKSLKKERIMFAIFLGLWGLVVLMGLAIVFWHSYGRDLLMRWRRRRFEREQRSGFENVVVPFKDVGPGQGATYQGEKEVQPQVPLRSFTPMMSPHPAANDSNHLQPPSRLTTMNNQSFDSFFDRDTPTSPAPAGGSKLAALGRKLTTRSRKEPADAEKAVAFTSADSVVQSNGSGWWSNLGLWSQTKEVGPGAVKRAFTRKRRPELTISTELADSARPTAVLPVIETTSPTTIESYEAHENHPPSAWSSSPSPLPPRAKPWLQPVVPTRRAYAAPPRHAQPKPTEPSSKTLPPRPPRHASVPVDVGGSTEDVFAMMAAQHQHQQVTPSPPGLPPRKPTAADPFATPFDDEARARRRSSGRYPTFAPGQNPFADSMGARAI
ncbi:hypothetical protein OF83DRAFT_1191364 [Amylostereum chailletii]|nr:hypothetical protein OF83DRAFT_1191364 [Amylostereum chailletii]